MVFLDIIYNLVVMFINKFISMLYMIDVHAHLCFPQFDADRRDVIKRCTKELSGVVVSSAGYGESLDVLRLVKSYPEFLFPTIGHHPTEGTDYKGTIELIEKNGDVIVGVGEVGLDYHWEKNKERREKQKRIFRKFISLAARLGKPLIIHSWDAEEECFNMVRDSGLVCVFHCFSGSIELAERIISEGDFYISISTQVCFSKHHRKLVRMVPLKRFLLETDSPFLSPYKYNTSLKDASGFDPERNYPWNIKLSAERIARIKGMERDEILKYAGRNAARVFGLEGIFKI